jgi:RNA-directed DNA polymerase
MSLKTPEKIRTLQRKLYLKAKAEPSYRFYLFYDKIHRADILRHAYDLVRANKGAPGVDGVTCAAIEAAGLENWLIGIGTDLQTKTYQPQAVRRVMIPKPGGGERPLGIPTIRDRVVQTAAKLVLEPIFEADLEPTAFGYRPGRSGIDAVKTVHRLLCQGFTDVVDADLSKYFDTIPHDGLLSSVAVRIVDRHVLRLVKLWLKAPVEDTCPKGRRRMSGGKQSTCGTPQGGVISPLLANRYMNRFLRHWRNRGCNEAFRAQIVNYADDFVILSRCHAEEALAWTRGLLKNPSLDGSEQGISSRRCRRPAERLGSSRLSPGQGLTPSTGGIVCARVPPRDASGSPPPRSGTPGCACSPAHGAQRVRARATSWLRHGSLPTASGDAGRGAGHRPTIVHDAAAPAVGLGNRRRS